MGKRVIFIFAVLLSAYSGKTTESPAGNPLAANPEYQDQPAPAKTNAGATAETDPHRHGKTAHRNQFGIPAGQGLMIGEFPIAEVSWCRCRPLIRSPWSNTSRKGSPWRR